MNNKQTRYLHIPTNQIYRVIANNFNNFILINENSSKDYSIDIPAFIFNNSNDWKELLYISDNGEYVFRGSRLWFINTISKTIWSINNIQQSNIDIIISKKKVDKNFYIFTSESYARKFLEKNIKRPLFKTSDNIEIYDGDMYYVVSGNKIYENKAASINVIANNSFSVNNKHIFSSYKLAEKAIQKCEEHKLYNTPCLSINDVATVYVTANAKERMVTTSMGKKMVMPKQPQALLELVKTKLKTK